MNFVIVMSWSLTCIADKPILILSAMKIEHLPIVNALRSPKESTVNKIPFVEGSVGNETVIAAYTGIGSINAGIVTSILINEFHPKGVIFTGVAASLQRNINFGDVIASTDVFSVNFGQYSIKGESFDGLLVNPMRGMKAPLVYKSSKRYIAILRSLQNNLPVKLFFGTVASDQHFPFNEAVDKLLTKNKVDALAMEDIGVAHASWLYSIPMISIRGISDNIYLKREYSRKKAAKAAKLAAIVTIKLIKHLGD